MFILSIYKASFDSLQKLTYSYDNSGNVTNKQCFQYDWLDRLTDAFTGDADCATFAATGTGSYNHSYTYDSLGNIISNAGNTYTYGDTAHKHAVTAAFDNGYSHDANGNRPTELAPRSHVEAKPRARLAEWLIPSPMTTKIT